MKREIPKKNYIIVGLIAIIVVVLVLYMAKLYNSVNINNKTSIMGNYLFNVTTNELDSYLLENPNIIIYWANSEDITNNSFEKELKKYIIKHDLQKNFVFVNTNSISEEEINNISKKYLNDELKNKNIDLKTIPNILVVEEGKIIDVLYTYQQEIEMNYVKEKFKSYGVID